MRSLTILGAALLAGASGGVAAGADSEPAEVRPAAASVLEPATLARAERIRSEVDARSRSLGARVPAVTEATGTDVVDSLVLVPAAGDGLPRTVPTANGVYYALCPAGANCPYPSPWEAWAASSFAPRRIALELALRTFRETSAALVVVALPTARPVWLVLERGELVADAGATSLDGELSVLESREHELVERVTLGHLFVPFPSLPPNGEILAVPLLDPKPPAVRLAGIRAAREGSVSALMFSLSARDDHRGPVSYVVSVGARGRVLALRWGRARSSDAITMHVRVRTPGSRTVMIRAAASDRAGNLAAAERRVRLP